MKLSLLLIDAFDGTQCQGQLLGGAATFAPLELAAEHCSTAVCEYQ